MIMGDSDESSEHKKTREILEPFIDCLNGSDQNVARNVDIKGHAIEISDGNQEYHIGNGTAGYHFQKDIDGILSMLLALWKGKFKSSEDLVGEFSRQNIEGARGYF